MPERIHSMSSTMRIVGRCLEIFIDPFSARNAARSLELLSGWGFPVCPLPYWLELHIRGLVTAYTPQRTVAFARHVLEHSPVIDAQVPAPVRDRSGSLHGPSHDRNTSAPHAEMVSDLLLSNVNQILPRAVVKEKQPDRKSFRHDVENGASGALRDLRDVRACVS